jgi:hypothetical protein
MHATMYSEGYRKYLTAFASHPLPSEFHQSRSSNRIARCTLEEESRIVMSSLGEAGEISSPSNHIRDRKLKRRDETNDLVRDIGIPKIFDNSRYDRPIGEEGLRSAMTTSSPVTP